MPKTQRHSDRCNYPQRTPYRLKKHNKIDETEIDETAKNDPTGDKTGVCIRLC